jgi:hypothetical protein
VLRRKLHCLAAIRTLRDHLHALLLEKRSDALSYDLMIVSEKDAQWHHFPHQ